MPFHSSYIYYSFPILVIHSEPGNKHEENSGIFQVTKSLKHAKCFTQNDKKPLLLYKFLHGFEAFRIQACEEPQ